MIYNAKDKFMYEILDDYKDADHNLKEEIFNEFIDLIFNSKNHRQITKRHIQYKILDSNVDTDEGKIFIKYSSIPYIYSKTKTKETDFISLVRQKINNIYNNYCETRICTRKEYMDLLKYPKQLYYQWVDGNLEIQKKELDAIIQFKLSEADKIKETYAKQKMHLTWQEFKVIVITYAKKAFDNFVPLDEFENKTTMTLMTETWCEDNFYIKYLCRYLDCGIKNFQKKYYGLYRKGKRSKLTYARCIDCGVMFWSNRNATKTIRCSKCQKEKDKINTRERVRKHRLKSAM